MGSSTFYAHSPITNVDEAYVTLCREATREYGTDPYNGSISTTNGVSVVQRTPVTRAAADRIVASRIENLSKWSECEAIAIGEPTKTRSRKVKVVVEPDEHGSIHLTHQHVADALDVALDALGDWKVDSCTPKYKVTTRAAGPVRRVWEVSGVAGEFPTRAAAMARAKELVADSLAREVERAGRPGVGYVSAPRTYEVCQRIRRDPEAAVIPTLVKATFAVTAEIAAGPLTFRHWLFYGWAAT